MSMEIEAYQNMPSFDQSQIEMLHEPLSTSVIEHRPGGGGKSLAYITGKTAIDTANRVFGFGKWGYRVVSRSCEKSCNLDGTITGIFYTADIELYVVGCPFPFPGEGIGIVVPTKFGITPECHEKARKEAVTDAMKRALRHYGDQFGLALYDQDALVEDDNGSLVRVKEVANKPANNQPKRIIEASNAPKQLTQAQPMTFIQVYNKGLQKGKWTKETFPSVASGILNGYPINKDSVNKLTAAQIAQLDAAIEQESAA